MTAFTDAVLQFAIRNQEVGKPNTIDRAVDGVAGRGDARSRLLAGARLALLCLRDRAH
jgi:hypothetical protein